jgi:hypothetical protein
MTIVTLGRGREVMVTKYVAIRHKPKAAMRAELADLVRAYELGGGTITRSHVGRVVLKCVSCAARLTVDLSFAVQFRPTCLKCGGEMRIVG